MKTHISKVWRVKTPSLWTYYSFHRDRLSINGVYPATQRVARNVDTGSVVIYNDPWMAKYGRGGRFLGPVVFALCRQRVFSLVLPAALLILILLPVLGFSELVLINQCRGA
jgi:hypothetical protein